MSARTEAFEAAELEDCDVCAEPASTVTTDGRILCRPHYTEQLRADNDEQHADHERDAA